MNTNEHKELRIYIFSAIEAKCTEISRSTCAAGNTIGLAVAGMAMDCHKNSEIRAIRGLNSTLKTQN